MSLTGIPEGLDPKTPLTGLQEGLDPKTSLTRSAQRVPEPDPIPVIFSIPDPTRFSFVNYRVAVYPKYRVIPDILGKPGVSGITQYDIKYTRIYLEIPGNIRHTWKYLKIP